MSWYWTWTWSGSSVCHSVGRPFASFLRHSTAALDSISIHSSQLLVCLCVCVCLFATREGTEARGVVIIVANGVCSPPSDSILAGSAGHSSAE